MRKIMVQIILLGLGMQSSALYLMSSMGQLPKADHAIFPDVGREATETYQYLEFLVDWQRKNNGVPITVLKEKSLYDDLLHLAENDKNNVSVPAFTQNEDGSIGMLRSQCAADYKITVMDNYIRDHIYHLQKGAKTPITAIWQGIALDEADRLNTPHEAWKINTYPFLGQALHRQGNTERLSWAKPMNRHGIMQWFLLHGLPIPPNSSCVFCPYQSDKAWALKKKHLTKDFTAAVAVDEAIRNGTSKGIHNPVYLHRSCRPLADAVFNIGQDQQYGKSSGYCHT